MEQKLKFLHWITKTLSMFKIIILIFILSCTKNSIRREPPFDFKDFDKVSELSSQKSNIKRILIISDDFLLTNNIAQFDLLFRNFPKTQIITLGFCGLKIGSVSKKIKSTCGYYFKSFLENYSIGSHAKEYELKDYLEFYRPQIIYFVFKNSIENPQHFSENFRDIISKYNVTCYKTEIPSTQVINCFNEYNLMIERNELLNKDLETSLKNNNIPLIRAIYQNFKNELKLSTR